MDEIGRVSTGREKIVGKAGAARGQAVIDVDKYLLLNKLCQRAKKLIRTGTQEILAVDSHKPPNYGS
jgi:hypothetical protein